VYASTNPDIRGVLMVTGTHEKSPINEDEPLEARSARVSLPQKPTADGAKKDVLTKTFTVARPYISDACFVYAFMPVS
jgi:hypothetical protein